MIFSNLSCISFSWMDFCILLSILYGIWHHMSHDYFFGISFSLVLVFNTILFILLIFYTFFFRIGLKATGFKTLCHNTSHLFNFYHLHLRCLNYLKIGVFIPMCWNKSFSRETFILLHIYLLFNHILIWVVQLSFLYVTFNKP